jgi:hypothetical protein
LVQDSTGTSPDRRAIATCASLRAAGLFIDSQSRFGNDAFSNLAMVKVWCLLQCSSWQRWRWAAAARYDPRDRFLFLNLLGFYLQI